MEKSKKAVRQSSVQCECGSWYRDVDSYCNMCGKYVKEPYTKEKKKRVIGYRPGKIWSKKKHRYLTQKEISEGQT